MLYLTSKTSTTVSALRPRPISSVYADRSHGRLDRHDAEPRYVGQLPSEAQARQGQKDLSCLYHVVHVDCNSIYDVFRPNPAIFLAQLVSRLGLSHMSAPWD